MSWEEKAQHAHWAELRGAIIEGGIARTAGLVGGEGSHHLSWIWMTVQVVITDKNDPRLHNALRVEWCKAYSWVKRYSEDVRLLREEMRCTIAFGYTEAEKWEELMREELLGSSPELTEGHRAYAAEHANTERKMCELLQGRWARILAKADAYLAARGVLDAETVVTVELEMGDELEPEDEEVRLKGEEEE
ncbi:hypothetical protein B0H16DRAFT_1743026 [Mycena metata]|uniref:Uncharacterized protein n=1 Tax=Mycena metata TaxID=1033252 RepID=A0AAD7H6T3_9AGAR|nr:hypothetical protein B0H16DRAFT_1743026 [Mycena metata]